MDAKKALIITWVGIGLLLAGIIGFFLGRSNFGKEQAPPGGQPGNQPSQVVQPGSQQGKEPAPSGAPPAQR